MEINKLLTKVNYKKATNRKIEYIVIHYVGATGGAQDNCRYFEKFYRAASAHYFVGHSGEVWQCVEDKDISWHCGALKYKHAYCRNDNSIGIEMCTKQDGNGVWYFEPLTVAATIDLVKELMVKYNIPVDRVIRHYDVTGKICPAPFVRNNTTHTWDDFIKNLEDKPVTTPTPTKSIDEIAKEVIQGKWGNGQERKDKLRAAGYDYSVVQARVNALKGGKPQAETVNKPVYNVDEIARKVIRGDYGNGTARKKALESLGYNYAEIQKRVNELLK